MPIQLKKNEYMTIYVRSATYKEEYEIDCSYTIVDQDGWLFIQKDASKVLIPHTSIICIEINEEEN